MSTHHFTVDVEEYFHPTAMGPYYPMSGWGALPRRASGVVDRLLGFLGERGIKGTFFVLGWLAEREREMVRSIVAGGHELASHGWEHELVGRLGPDGFRASVRRSKELLEDVGQVRVLGYRAPSFSIVPGLEWAFDILLEVGYVYDASLFPITGHPTYGYPDAQRSPHCIERPGGRIVEVPATTARVMGSTLPAGGGAYFRLLPYGLVRAGLRQAGRDGFGGTFYVHPWELDTWMPDSEAPWLPRLRTFGGRTRMWSRLERLCGEFRFRRVDATVLDLIEA